GLVLAVLLADAALSSWNLLWLAANEQRVAHSYAVLAELEDVLSLLKDAETGQRGYLLTGDESYLQPYREAVARIHGRLDHLQDLTSDNPAHRQGMKALRDQAERRLAQVAAVILLRQDQGFAEAQKAVRTGAGKKLMDELRATVDGMKNGEEGLLGQ